MIQSIFNLSSLLFSITVQSDDSYQNQFPSPGSSYTGSCNSLNSERRWRRIQSTSLESFSRRQSQHDIIAHEVYCTDIV